MTMRCIICKAPYTNKQNASLHCFFLGCLRLLLWCEVVLITDATETAAPPSLGFSMESTRKITRAKHHPYTGGHKATMSLTTSGWKSSYMKDGAGSGFCPIKAAKSRMPTAQRSNITTNTWRSGWRDILLVSMVFMANWTAIPLM